MNIDLDTDQVALLQAVADDKVARHRMRVVDSAAVGVDYEHRPDPGLASAYRRVGRQLQPLRRMKLVELVPGEPGAARWPYKVTAAGQTVLDHARNLAAEEQA